MSRDAVRLRAVKVTVECFITRSLEAYESLYYFWRLFPVIFSAWLVHGFFLHFACRMHSFIACLDPYAGLVRFWFCVIATLTFFSSSFIRFLSISLHAKLPPDIASTLRHVRLDKKSSNETTTKKSFILWSSVAKRVSQIETSTCSTFTRVRASILNMRKQQKWLQICNYWPNLGNGSSDDIRSADSSRTSLLTGLEQPLPGTHVAKIGSIIAYNRFPTHEIS